MDPDQTAHSGAVLSRSTKFVKDASDCFTLIVFLISSVCKCLSLFRRVPWDGL